MNPGREATGQRRERGGEQQLYSGWGWAPGPLGVGGWMSSIQGGEGLGSTLQIPMSPASWRAPLAQGCRNSPQCRGWGVGGGGGRARPSSDHQAHEYHSGADPDGGLQTPPGWSPDPRPSFRQLLDISDLSDHRSPYPSPGLNPDPKLRPGLNPSTNPDAGPR